MNKQVYIIAEIGINHNGDIKIAEELIRAAADCGANAVKFQKRTVNKVYTKEELAQPRQSVFGTTNGDLKHGLEFGEAEYDRINELCEELEIDWFASPWDLDSVDFLSQYRLPYIKVASAGVTDKRLLSSVFGLGVPVILSTGMCSMTTIRNIVGFVSRWWGTQRIASLMHCTSTYPSQPEELNLRGILTLKEAFPDIPIGYSGHEAGVPPTIMAAALGATMIERHITLSKSMWGSDQAASLDVEGFRRMVRDVRLWERCRGDGIIQVYDSEKPIIKKLRRHDHFQ